MTGFEALISILRWMRRLPGRRWLGNGIGRKICGECEIGRDCQSGVKAQTSSSRLARLRGTRGMFVYLLCFAVCLSTRTRGNRPPRIGKTRDNLTCEHATCRLTYFRFRVWEGVDLSVLT
ncbi:hypothetical protein K402DRAFT_48666 [Aulographum hederae CBS 113979]|uniref:Uncharacterized protein n=1 Tax=Aulographum hederae CBS 113979 TaxID=1176131 RepID=A0A6G1H301_9PEZI|nr:hypothetical protein K402DRAFT_48666 [Aulographum hederae CBS 113979]